MFSHSREFASLGLPSERSSAERDGDAVMPPLGITSHQFNEMGSIWEKDNQTTQNQVEMAFSQLRPEQWINPSAVSWDSWDFLNAAATNEVQVVTGSI